VDLARREVEVDGLPVSLSRKEFALLSLLVSSQGQVLTHDQILREVWGPSHQEDTHYLRVLVGNLRQKLGDDPMRPRFILTVQGVGYRLAV
jgi:two-component system KDP operon response regulator KdpE